MAKTSSGSRGLIFAMLLLGIITLASFAFIIWRVLVVQDRITDVSDALAQQEQKNITYPEYAIIKYPSFFKTQEMQRKLMTKLKILDKPIFSNETTYQANGSCGFSCPLRRLSTTPSKRSIDTELADYLQMSEEKDRFASTENRQKRATATDAILGTINHHACCTSQHMSVAPNTATNIVGVSRNLVQFPGNKQYFLTEDCIHNQGCGSTCQCDQPDPFLYLAIVYTANGASFEIDEIKIEGSCKCMNYT